MRRREFVALVAGLSSWAVPLQAQHSAMPAIGLLGSASPELWTKRLEAFREGLAEVGFVEGRNVAIEYRWAHSQNERLPGLAAELVRDQVSVIVVLGNTSSALAAKAATSTIPIVARIAADPVELGLVRSLNEPGGTITGATTLGAAVGPKQLELLHELIPDVKVFALLVNPTNPALAESGAREMRAAAQRLGFELHIVHASADRDFPDAFATLRKRGAGALIVGVDAFFNTRNERLAALALESRVPTVAPYREFAEGGGLMSYGASIERASRQVGVYTGRILRGEKPANLPFQLPTELGLVINLKTAARLGLTIPSAILARAEDAIE
jgi:putative tryptophan/tyrosine transport system substrate-binding protein